MNLFNSRGFSPAAFVPCLALLAVCIAAASVGALRGQGADTVGSSAASAAPTSEEFDILMYEGEEVYYRDCAECHADGGMAPVLSDLSSLSNKGRVVTWIVQGVPDGSMPAFGPTLTDRQIAAVATFVRNYWENSHGAVTETDVKQTRAELESKKAK